MMDADEQLAAIRALTNREPPPYPDLREHVAELWDENSALRHRVMVLEGDVRGRVAANVALNEELLAERQKGSGNLPGVTVHASQEYAHEKDLSNHTVDAQDSGSSSATLRRGTGRAGVTKLGLNEEDAT